METYLTVKEFANVMGLHPQSVRNMIARGSIPYYKIGASVRLKLEDFRKEEKWKEKEE